MEEKIPCRGPCEKEWPKYGKSSFLRHISQAKRCKVLYSEDEISTLKSSSLLRKKEQDLQKKKEASADSKADVKKTDKDEKETKDGKEKKEAEATFEILNNPARVMKPQLQVIKMEPPNSTEKAMYQPIKDISIGGKLDNSAQFND